MPVPLFLRSVDLLILGVIMPHGGGQKVLPELLKLNPDVKVLLASRYSVEEQAVKLLKEGCGGFIQKPFTANALSAKIREVLDK